MSDALFKLRMLPNYIIGSIKEWRDTVWRIDLDSPICCNGWDCGCQGSSYRDMYTANEEQP